MATLHLHLLGGFEARLGARSLRLPRKGQALLAYLAVAGRSPIPRAELATLLWGGDQDGARNSLRQSLFQVRRALGPLAGSLAVQGDTVALKQHAVQTDVQRLEALAAGHAESALAQAAALYRGDLLAGVDVGEGAFDEWLRGQRTRLHELAIDVLARLLAAQRARGALEDAIRTALRLLQLDPLHEEAHRALMRAYASAGRRAAALRQYQLCVAALEREVQAEPEPETRRLYVELLRRAPGVDPGSAHRPHAAPPPGAPVFAVPLIGRDVERGRLRVVAAGVTAGHGHVGLVLGEAGVGKSRLVLELAAELAGSGWLVLEGRGYQTERGLPLAPWIAALRAAAEDDALLGPLPAPWRKALALLFPELAVAARGSVRAAPSSENQRRLFEALWHLLRRLAARQPVLVLLEDLHWIDSASLEFLAFLARRLDGTRVCVIGTVRLDESEIAALGPVRAELPPEGLLTEVLVGPLPRPATQRFIEAFAPRRARRPTPEEVERIWQMSEGNPFVVVEALRSLDAAGDRRPGGVLALPEGVRRLILDRVDRLGPDARHTVAAASVIGRDFDHVLVGHATGLGDDVTAAAFEELVRARLLQQRDTGFEFAHDRVREAVLGALLPPRRRVLHAAVTRAIEALHAGDLARHCGALAYHSREGGLWPEAVDYLRQQSAVVTARGAYRDAVVLLEQAFALLPRLSPGRSTTERACDVRLGLGDRSIVVGDFARAEAVLSEALALARQLGDERRAALAQAELAQRDAFVRRLDRGIVLASEALATAERLGDHTLETRAAFAIGIIRASRGEHPSAIAVFERVLRTAGDDPLTFETIGLGLCHVGGRAWMAASLAELGGFDEALALVHDALMRADAAGHVFSMARTRIGLGRIHLLRGDLDPAVAALVASHELIQTYQLSFLERACAGLLASARVQAGTTSPGDVTWPRPAPAALLVAEAEALLAAGQLDGALGAATAALAIARAGSERGSEGWALMLVAEAHTRGAGAEALAEPAYEESLAIATALGLRPLEARCRHGLGQLLARRGRSAAARAHLIGALALLESMGMTRWVEPTRIALDAVTPAAAKAGGRPERRPQHVGLSRP